MIKRLLQSILLAVLATIFFGMSVLAAWEFMFPTTVSDNSSVTRIYYPVMMGFGGQTLVDAGKISSNGTNTNMQIGATTIPYMMSTTNVTAAIPTLPANGVATLSLYTGYTPLQTGFPIITGSGGYVIVGDNTSLEIGNNGTLQMYGYLDASGGAGKYLVSKTSACLLDGSTAGRITATMLADYKIIYYDVGQNATQAVGDNWGGNTYDAAQSFTTTDAFVIDKVAVQCMIGLGVAGNSTMSIRLMGVDPSANPALTTGSASMNSNTWVVFDLTDYALAGATQYAIVFDDTAGDSWWRYVGAGSTYGGGTRWSNVNEAGWVEDATSDMMFRVYMVDPSVTVSGLSSGEVLVSASANTTHWILDVGGSSNSTALVGASMPDNTNDWIFGQNDVMPYCDNITLSVNGTENLWLAPTGMLSGVTIPDRRGGNNPGTITWGSNSNVNISYGEMTSFEAYIAAIGAVEHFSMPVADIPETWFASGGDASALPFYDSFSSVAVQTGQPVQMLYALAVIGVAFGAFIGIATFTRSALLAYIVMVAVFGIGSTMTIIPAWIVFVMIIIGAGIMYLYKQVAY